LLWASSQREAGAQKRRASPDPRVPADRLCRPRTSLSTSVPASGWGGFPRRIGGKKDSAFVDEEFSPGGRLLGRSRPHRLGAVVWRASRNLDAVYFSNDDLAIGGYFHCLEKRHLPFRGIWRCFGYNGLDIARLDPPNLCRPSALPESRWEKWAPSFFWQAVGPQVVDLGI